MGCTGGKASAPRSRDTLATPDNTLLASQSSTKHGSLVSFNNELPSPGTAGSRHVAHAETTAPNRFQPNSTLSSDGGTQATVVMEGTLLSDNATQVFEIGEHVTTVFGFKGTISFGPDTNNYYIVASADESRFVGASAIKKAAKPDSLQVDDHVIVITDFASDGSSRTPLKRGLKGVVSDYHEGDAYIKFGGSEQLRVLSKNLHNLEKIKAQPKVAVEIQTARVDVNNHCLHVENKLTQKGPDSQRRVMNPKSPRTDERLEKTKHEAESGGAFTCVAFTPKNAPLVLAPTSRRQRQLCCCA